jgi:predicted nucleic acid-binding protein
VTLVDTNVLLDLVTDDPNWSAWSIARLEEAALAGPILINDVVYAETSIRYEQIEDLDAMLAEAVIDIAPISRAALFLAGKVFQRYRALGGTRTGVLPGWPLLTRDTGRYRSYFPKITLIAPTA